VFDLLVQTTFIPITGVLSLPNSSNVPIGNVAISILPPLQVWREKKELIGAAKIRCSIECKKRLDKYFSQL